MQGEIKTYLPDKHYGFIKGDDSKDYFFTKRTSSRERTYLILPKD